MFICRLILFGIAALLVSGCAGPPRAETTFLRSVDLIDMTDRMATSLAGNEAVAAHTAADPPWIISMHAVENHTNQIMRSSEKWLYVNRLRALLGATDFSERHNLIWVIPPERWQIVMREYPDALEPYGLRLDPTHLLSAEFAALTSTSAAGRSDTYLCEYQLTDLDDGRLIWSDSWEVKRAITGLTYD